MGSFTSIPKVAGSDNQDDDLQFPETTVHELLERCKIQLQDLPKPFERKIRGNSGGNKLLMILSPKPFFLLRVVRFI